MKSQFNSTQLLQFTLLIFLSLFSTLSCKKNELIDLAIKPTILDINRVKDYYLRNKSLDSRTNNDMFVNNNSIPQFSLAWELAYYPSAYNGQTVFIPIKDKELITNKYLDATMVFLLDSLNNIEQRLLVLAMDNIYYESNQLEPTVDNFTGYSFQMNKDLYYGLVCKFMNGTFVEYLDTVLVDSTQSIYNQMKSRTLGPKCPTFGGRSWWDETFGSGGSFWSSIGNFFKTVFGGSGGNNGNGNGRNGYGGQFFGSGGGYSGGSDGGSYGTGGGGPNNNGEPKFRDIFSEYQLKLFTKAIKKLNDYFDSEEEMAYWLLILGPDCLEKIANLPPISIDGLEELDCLQEFLRFKASGLTVEEWEDYKEDKACKNLTENKAKVEKFTSDISKAIEEELRQLSLDFPGVPFDADLFKSLMSKVVLKKTGKLIPLVGVGLDIVELRAAYAAGDYLAMGLAIGSVLTEVIPCAMVVDVVFDAAIIGNTVFKAYKSLSELKTFLGANSSIFDAIFKTIDDLDLTDALEFLEKWTNNSADQFKVLLGNKSMDDFLEALAKNLNSTWVPVSDKIKTITSGGITTTFNKLSNSGYPTLDIFINGIHFKIRF